MQSDSDLSGVKPQQLQVEARGIVVHFLGEQIRPRADSPAPARTEAGNLGGQRIEQRGVHKRAIRRHAKKPLRFPHRHPQRGKGVWVFLWYKAYHLQEWHMLSPLLHLSLQVIVRGFNRNADDHAFNALRLQDPPQRQLQEREPRFDLGQYLSGEPF